MNRLEMADKIKTRLPELVNLYEQDCKRGEKLRRTFVTDYPVSRIPRLTLDEYVIGRGADNRSFCYRLERELDSLGRILGATAFKFGVYYGRTKSEPTEKYRFAVHWGSTTDEAFTSVKERIVVLLRAAAKGDTDVVAKTFLSRMFKGKLLFMYHPEVYAPVYSREHLEHFITELNLSGSLKTGADMQRALMEYRATWPALMLHPPALFMRLLYDVCHHPDGGDSGSGESIRAPLLDDAIQGSQFIREMPASKGKSGGQAAGYGKTDFPSRERQLRRIGDRGENIVLALERKRLREAGKAKLASRVDHISETDDSAGFDILSFETNGKPRRIEVKATTANNLDRGFYMSSNELKKASQLSNYYLYLVFSTMTRKPRVLPLKHPALKGSSFVLRPMTYQVTLSSDRA